MQSTITKSYIVCPFCERKGTIIERKDIVEYDKVMCIVHDSESDDASYTVENKNRYQDDRSEYYSLECEYCGAEWRSIREYLSDLERYNTDGDIGEQEEDDGWEDR